MDHATSRRAAIVAAGISLHALALAALAGFSGCDRDAGHNKDASPIVLPDSDRGKKAVAESEALLKLRREQEAKSKKRLRVSPEEG